MEWRWLEGCCWKHSVRADPSVKRLLTEIADRGNHYDAANSWFTVPYSGLYRVSAKICLTVAVGTRIRLAFAKDVSGVITNLLNKQDYQVNAAAQHYTLYGVISLVAGERIFLMADQNTAGAVALSAPISTNADLTWSIQAI